MCRGSCKVLCCVKLFNLCNHLAKHCFHVSLTKKQRFREVKKFAQCHELASGRAGRFKTKALLRRVEGGVGGTPGHGALFPFGLEASRGQEQVFPTCSPDTGLKFQNLEQLHEDLCHQVRLFFQLRSSAHVSLSRATRLPAHPLHMLRKWLP